MHLPHQGGDTEQNQGQSTLIGSSGSVSKTNQPSSFPAQANPIKWRLQSQTRQERSSRNRLQICTIGSPFFRQASRRETLRLWFTSWLLYTLFVGVSNTTLEAWHTVHAAAETRKRPISTIFQATLSVLSSQECSTDLSGRTNLSNQDVNKIRENNYHPTVCPGTA